MHAKDGQINAPRDDLIRMCPGVELRSSGDGEGRTLVGYAAVFNSDTIINSWEGRFIERFAPGAFKRTLNNNGDRIKILFNHGMDPSIGDKPLGRASVIREDAHGLYVEVPLSRTSYNDDLVALLEDGAIDGMSFRFSVPDGGETWVMPTKKGDLPQRTVTEAKVPELGPVTFPAYTASSAGVRSREEFTVWRSLDLRRQTAIKAIVGRSAGDEDAATLALAVDAALDALDDLLDTIPGAEEAQALLTAAEETVDSLLDLLGVSDVDPEDTGTLPGGPAMSTPPGRSASTTTDDPELRAGHHSTVPPTGLQRRAAAIERGIAPCLT